MQFWKKLQARLLVRWRKSEEDALIADFKQREFSTVTGVVAEVGAGAGANFQYLPKEIHWIGIEPNEPAHAELRVGAKRHGIARWELHKALGEALPLADNSCDVVIATRVLCSVRDQERVLKEIRRVLKPQGVYYFIEHVAAPKGSWLRFVQSICTPWNAFFSIGCRLNRETKARIEGAGFSTVTSQECRVQELVLPYPYIFGKAIK